MTPKQPDSGLTEQIKKLKLDENFNGHYHSGASMMKEMILSILAAASVTGENVPYEKGTSLQAKVDFYREQTEKIRKWLDENKIGNPCQGFFDAVLKHLESKEGSPGEERRFTAIDLVEVWNDARICDEHGAWEHGLKQYLKIRFNIDIP
jgi:hypothetical protein